MAAVSSAPELVEAPVRGDARAVRVPHGTAAVPVARRTCLADLAQRLRCRRRDEVLGDAAVVVSELLGNAVRHARALPDGVVVVRWQVRGPVVDVEVTDGGGDSPVRPSPVSMSASGGRGLRIVRSLAHEWGVDEDANGRRTVWAALGGPSRRRRR